MFKRILILMVLLILLLPVMLAGYGLYLGRDVSNAFRVIYQELSGNSLTISSIPLLPSDQTISKYREVVWLGEVESERLREASGLAYSTSQKGVLFSFNDGGNAPELFAMDEHGRHLGSWLIDYDSNHDFESIAAWQTDEGSFLMIADTGDNLYWRKSVHLIVIREPDIDTQAQDMKLPVERSIEFTYPSGQRDVEALAVNGDQIILISKRHVPAEVLVLPLEPEKENLVAKPYGHLVGIPLPTPRDEREDPTYGKYRSTVTGLDIHGRDALVMTYKDVYHYHRKMGESWDETFGRAPVRIPLPEINGLESVTFSDNGREFFIAGEREDTIGRMGLFRARL